MALNKQMIKMELGGSKLGKGSRGTCAQGLRAEPQGEKVGQPNSSEAKYFNSWHSSRFQLIIEMLNVAPVQAEFTSLIYFT